MTWGRAMAFGKKIQHEILVISESITYITELSISFFETSACPNNNKQVVSIK